MAPSSQVLEPPQNPGRFSLFGVYPWIKRHTGRFGIMFPYVREDAFRF
jgi:hypothetical protein